MTTIEELIGKRRRLKLQTENPVSETYIEMFIQDLKSLQEPTEEIEVEIKREMEKLKSSLDKLKSMGLSVTYNTYYSLIEELREKQKKIKKAMSAICLRCGVEAKEIKREGSSGCSSRGFYYPKHLWK